MVTDLKYLQQMTGDDKNMMKEMIELFLDQLVEAQNEFESLVRNKNWIELSRAAHKLKSSAMVMGVESLAQEMKELEFLAKEVKNTEKYPEYIMRFKTLSSQIEVELKTYLALHH